MGYSRKDHACSGSAQSSDGAPSGAEIKPLSSADVEDVSAADISCPRNIDQVCRSPKMIRVSLGAVLLATE